jgi:hypothetical protein
MKTSRRAFGLLLVLLPAAGVRRALAQETPLAPSFSIKEREPRTGTNIRQTVVAFNLPLDKSYQQLTFEQQAIVRDNYVTMHPLDEPPFPADGLGPFFTVLQKGATKLQAEGDLVLHVAVGIDGRPTAAKVVKAPSQEFGEFAASAALLTGFKPALCKGHPCAMEFPVRLSFTRGVR